MKIGDAVEWKAVNRSYRGTITKTAKDELIVIMENGRSFPLDNLIGSNLKIL